MKKEDLIKLGLDEELAAKVETALADEMKGFIPKGRFDEVNTEKKRLETSLAERNTELETLKNSSGDADALKQQISDLQAQYQQKEDAHAQELRQIKLESALSAALTDAKAKNHKAVKALLDMKQVEMLDDGSVKGLAEQIKALADAPDSKFMFESADSKKPAFKGAKTGESGNEDGEKLTLDKFLALRTEEQIRFKTENENWKELLTFER